jgi:hypothetical protein
MLIKIIKFMIACFLLWSVVLLTWYFRAPLIDKLSAIIPSLNYVYLTSVESLLVKHKQKKATRISWEQLMPITERQIIKKYQQPTAMNLAEQILLSINASTDEAYRDAMFSTNVVEDLLGQQSAISGFIVPLELGSEQQLTSFFLVPYFGACIHYPPPPPNQLIFVRVDGAMKIPDINIAYTVTGVLKQGLYEDILGTSAYQLDLISIKLFSGEPDDFRLHQY